jgi:rhamnose utilization protein RhaD (predicted bifunctional aldolase and dehydrogenase)
VLQIFEGHFTEVNEGSIAEKQQDEYNSILVSVKRRGVANAANDVKESFQMFITVVKETSNRMKSQDSFEASESAKFIRKVKHLKFVVFLFFIQRFALY